MFFIDLEPAPNNKDMFEIKFLHHTKIKIEEPRDNKQTIQCLRCQGFGHTKAYCNFLQNVSAMEIIIYLRSVKKPRTSQQSVLFVEEVTQAIIEIVLYIKNSNRRFNQKKPMITVKMYPTPLSMLNGTLLQTQIYTLPSQSLMPRQQTQTITPLALLPTRIQSQINSIPSSMNLNP